MILNHISSEVILFFIIYGVTGVVPLLAALYLLLRKGNAFAENVTPPVRLRRWAAAFFAVSALGHVWWYLFYIHSGDLNSLDDLLFSKGYLTVVMLDCLTMLTTMSGTLLAMLQDRKRPVWPLFLAMIPFVVLWGVLMVRPSYLLMQISVAYVLLIYLLFTVYVAFAVRRYGRWLRDNYADLEHKEVWLSHLLSLVCLLMFILYALIDSNITLIYILHLIELVLFIFLLWRVETLPMLAESCAEETVGGQPVRETPLAAPAREQKSASLSANIDMAQIEKMLAERCVDTQLYLQHDLTLQQLAKALGTNRSYLSQYFSRQSITYNTYINNLRINHFIARCQEVAATHQPFTVQQLASQSGYRSYSTFSLAFKQRMGQSVTAWMGGLED